MNGNNQQTYCNQLPTRVLFWMIRTILLFFFTIQSWSGFAQIKMDLSKPPDTPQLFAKGIISTPLYERDMAISPDGKEMMFTILVPASGFMTIMYLKKDEQGRWSKPATAPFSGHYSDLEPAFSADGKKLFFASNRPLQGVKPKDYDIWFTEKVKGEWTVPVNAGPRVNAAGDEFYPSVAKNGNLYFTAAREKGLGHEDIWMCRWQNGVYTEPEDLDSGVNSTMYEFNAFVSPDEELIIFSSFGRKDDVGRGDLYISFKDDAGHWRPAKNMSLLNSNQLDYCPFLSFDKKILFFTSEKHNLPASYTGKPATYDQLKAMPSTILNGGGNIYWVSFESVLKRLRE